jgi:hypothetical protein
MLSRSEYLLYQNEVKKLNTFAPDPKSPPSCLARCGDKMVVMQDGGDLVTILPYSQISLKNGILPISTNQKLITCATHQEHIIHGNSIVMMFSFITKRNQELITAQTCQLTK